jgi:hypothetical protein
MAPRIAERIALSLNGFVQYPFKASLVIVIVEVDRLQYVRLSKTKRHLAIDGRGTDQYP